MLRPVFWSVFGFLLCCSQTSVAAGLSTQQFKSVVIGSMESGDVVSGTVPPGACHNYFIHVQMSGLSLLVDLNTTGGVPFLLVKESPVLGDPSGGDSDEHNYANYYQFKSEGEVHGVVVRSEYLSPGRWYIGVCNYEVREKVYKEGDQDGEPDSQYSFMATLSRTASEQSPPGPQRCDEPEDSIETSKNAQLVATLRELVEGTLEAELDQPATDEYIRRTVGSVVDHVEKLRLQVDATSSQALLWQRRVHELESELEKTKEEVVRSREEVDSIWLKQTSEKEKASSQAEQWQEVAERLHRQVAELTQQMTLNEAEVVRLSSGYFGLSAPWQSVLSLVLGAGVVLAIFMFRQPLRHSKAKQTVSCNTGPWEPPAPKAGAKKGGKGAGAGGCEHCSKTAHKGNADLEAARAALEAERRARSALDERLKTETAIRKSAETSQLAAQRALSEQQEALQQETATRLRAEQELERERKASKDKDKDRKRTAVCPGTCRPAQQLQSKLQACEAEAAQMRDKVASIAALRDAAAQATVAAAGWQAEAENYRRQVEVLRAQCSQDGSVDELHKELALAKAWLDALRGVGVESLPIAELCRVEIEQEAGLHRLKAAKARRMGAEALPGASVVPTTAIQMCGACEERCASMMVLPCQHVSLCMKCSETVTQCPECRGDVDQTESSETWE